MQNGQKIIVKNEQKDIGVMKSPKRNWKSNCEKWCTKYELCCTSNKLRFPGLVCKRKMNENQLKATDWILNV